MPSLSPAFTIEGNPNPAEHVIAYGATVDLAIAGFAYNTISWSIAGTSKSDQAAPSITLGGTPLGSSASFVMPADPSDGLGRSFRVKCRVTDAAGNEAVQYGIVGALNDAGLLPVPVGEEVGERNATHGWTDVVNAGLNGSGGGGGGYDTVHEQDNSAVTQRAILKFHGAHVFDDSLNSQTTAVFGPQSNALYVDAGTAVDADQQTGSYPAPFATLTAAVAAAGDNSHTIMITAGDYSAESDITWNPSGSNKRLTIICPTGLFGGNGFNPGADNFDVGLSAKLPTISASPSSSHLRIAGCWWSAESITGTGFLKLESCAVFGASGTVTGNPLITNRCYIARPAVGGTAGVQSTLTDFALTSGTIISAGSAAIVEALLCRFGGTITISFSGSAGTLRVDAMSNFYWKAATETLTNGSKVIIGDLAA